MLFFTLLYIKYNLLDATPYLWSASRYVSLTKKINVLSNKLFIDIICQNVFVSLIQKFIYFVIAPLFMEIIFLELIYLLLAGYFTKVYWKL